MFTFRPHPSFGCDYTETQTLGEMKAHLKLYTPESSRYRAIQTGDFHTVLYFSRYIQGPTIAGYLREHA